MGLDGLLSQDESRDCDDERGEFNLPIFGGVLEPDVPSTGSNCPLSVSITSGEAAGLRRLVLHAAASGSMLLAGPVREGVCVVEPSGAEEEEEEEEEEANCWCLGGVFFFSSSSDS